MRKAIVYRNGAVIGTLVEESRSSYIFRYDERWFADSKKPAVSVTMPKTQIEYPSEYLFPFFFNLLSEGANRELQCERWEIQDEDHFGLLLATAHTDTAGAITVRPVTG